MDAAVIERIRDKFKSLQPVMDERVRRQAAKNVASTCQGRLHLEGRRTATATALAGLRDANPSVRINAAAALVVFFNLHLPALPWEGLATGSVALLALGLASVMGPALRASRLSPALATRSV